MSNTFTQLDSANDGGDYLALKKSKNIYNINKSKPTTNTNVIIEPTKHNKNNFYNRLMFGKGFTQETTNTGISNVCTLKNTTNFTAFPYERSVDNTSANKRTF